MTEELNPITQGVHHVGLTVPNVKQTSEFFVKVLGFEKIGAKPDYPAIFVTDGSIMLTLWQAEDSEKMIPFDRKNNIGLHHLTLRVESFSALDELHETLKNIDDMEIEFAPENLGTGSNKHMICLIPGGVRVEFIALA